MCVTSAGSRSSMCTGIPRVFKARAAAHPTFPPPITTTGFQLVS
jgi:hypothetical protein